MGHQCCTAVKDRAGQLVAVIVVGIWLEHFQDALRVQGLPTTTVVTITNEKGIVIARNRDGPGWIGRDVKSWRTYAYASETLEGSIIAPWSHFDDIDTSPGFRLPTGSLGACRSDCRRQWLLRPWPLDCDRVFSSSSGAFY